MHPDVYWEKIAESQAAPKAQMGDSANTYFERLSVVRWNPSVMNQTAAAKRPGEALRAAD